MMKQIAAAFLTVAILCSSLPAVSLANDVNEHDAYLEQVLFGREDYITLQ